MSESQRRLKPFPKSKSSESPFTLRERMEIVKKWKIESQDPHEFLPQYFARYKRPVPAIPEQAISFFPSQIERLVNDGDAEAIKLALEVMPEQFEPIE